MLRNGWKRVLKNLCDCFQNRCVKILTGHQHNFEKNLLRCNWSPDGSKVTSGSADRMVYIWDTTSRRILYKVNFQANWIVQLVNLHCESFCKESHKWGASVSPFGLFFPLQSVSLCFVFLFCVLFFLPLRFFLFYPLCCLLLATVMAESCYFWTCNRNSVCRLVFTLVYTHCRELINQWGSCDREVTIIHVTVDGHWTSDILSLLFIQVSIFYFLTLVLSFLPSFVSPFLEVFLWCKGEVWTFNLDLAFLIMRMEISWFSWEILVNLCQRWATSI
jgi:WD40 repeat protein